MHLHLHQIFPILHDILCFRLFLISHLLWNILLFSLSFAYDSVFLCLTSSWMAVLSSSMKSRLLGSALPAQWHCQFLEDSRHDFCGHTCTREKIDHRKTATHYLARKDWSSQDSTTLFVWQLFISFCTVVSQGLRGYVGKTSVVTLALGNVLASRQNNFSGKTSGMSVGGVEPTDDEAAVSFLHCCEME